MMRVLLILTLTLWSPCTAKKEEIHRHPHFPRVSLSEDKRLEEYAKRNYTWPIQKFSPDTEGWTNLMKERIGQVTELEGNVSTGIRYEGFMQTLRSAVLAPNFTEHGFGLARCPEDLLAALQEGIHDGLDTAHFEGEVEPILGPRCKFISRQDLTRRVLEELKHYAGTSSSNAWKRDDLLDDFVSTIHSSSHYLSKLVLLLQCENTETWVGFPLIPFKAYGFRLYQNNSQLLMHVDKMQTHVVSFILHIDSSEDADPWPIFIEDLQGRTHEVTLTPGDMCFHGRPKVFNGSWYTSVFVHYYPKFGWAETHHELEAHYVIPPEWNAPAPAEKKYEPLEMIGTSMREPNCPHQWCRTQESIKWSGPGEEGYWIDAEQQKHPFNPQPVEWNDEL
eukprot:scaffold7087_cov168-Amphora_coffeaeformis.AAC.8